MSAAPVIQAVDLSIAYRLGGGWLNALNDIQLAIAPGEIHGLVGESGSGKSTLALALMRYLAPNARISAGEIIFEGELITSAEPGRLQALWGKRMALVPQDALAALNPSMRVGDQIAEVVRQQGSVSKADIDAAVIDMLARVHIPDGEQVARRYPHQLSGGMQQRVTIAMALIARPRLLILDEPTTSLDVTTQAAILDLVRDLIRTEGAAALYVSHDLGLVAQLCDTVTVLYGGEIMDSGPVRALFRAPRHPYTLALLASRPRLTLGENTRLPVIEGSAPSLAGRSSACVFVERCPAAIALCAAEKPPLEHTPDGRLVRCHRWRELADGSLVLPAAPVSAGPAEEPLPEYVLHAGHLAKTFDGGGMFGRPQSSVRALRDVSLSVRRRATLGIVGESGSGKTTFARCVVGLETADEGQLELLDVPLRLSLNDRPREQLRALQMIFQNPNEALNPYRTVGAALSRAVRRLNPGLKRDAVRDRVAHLLQVVRLTPEYADRYPNELSGGEKQRVGIARAFAGQPALVVADEPTSALDVSVQAAILNLLKDLRSAEGVSYIFISHDLRAVAYLADWVAVMYLGQVVEVGTARQVYEPPLHPYTEALLSALPEADPDAPRTAIRLEGDPPSPRRIPSGCPFHPRCPRFLGSICETTPPPWQDAGGGHTYACHISPDELRRLQGGPAGIAPEAAL